MPRCGALSLLKKTLHYMWGVIVVLRPWFAAALIVRRRYLIAVPWPMFAAARKYLIVVPRPSPAAPLVVHRR